MSRTVDERVVEMRFDNQQFERNVQTSISTIERLQNSLKMEGASNGLKSVEKAANEISLDKIANGVEVLQNRFSTLGIVGMRAIENITDSVIRLAAKTVNFLTEGLIQGGIKRAMNIENAHFQLQGLLKDEEKVQAVMQDAMDSVDGTAYAYDSAAKAASQFAASGMRAGKDMQSALRAITGVAAMTNSEYEDISRIFTTVSGNGRLMGEQLLQLSSRGLNAAATLADYMTKVGDGVKVTEADVRDMVSKGEISFELFSKAMDDTFGEHAKKANETFTGAMSNIKAALARIGAAFISPLVVQNGAIVQLFNAIRERINDVKNSIGPMADQFTESVNKIANAAKTSITRINSEDAVKIFSNNMLALTNVFSGLWSVIKPIGQAFKDIFPAATAEGLISFTAKLKEITSKLKLTDAEAQNLRDTFKGVFSVLKLLVDAFITVSKGVGNLLSKLTGIRGGFLGITGAMGRWLEKTTKAIDDTDAFKSLVGGLSEYLGRCVDSIKKFVATLNEKFISPGFEGILGLLQKLWEIVGKVGSKISDFFKSIGDAFNGNSMNGAFTMMGALILMKTAYKKFFDDWSPVIKRWKTLIQDGFFNTLEAVVKAPEGIISAFNALKSSLWTFNKSMKYDNIMKLSKALLILAAAMLVISLIDKDKMTASLAVLTALVGEMVGVLKIYDAFGSAKIGASVSLTAAATSMIGLAIAVSILASAMKKLSGLDTGGMIRGVGGITALVAVLVSASRVMSKNKKAISKFGGQMIVMSLAVLVLASVCKKLSALSLGELAKSVGGVLSLTLIFVSAAKILSKNGATISKFAGQMIVMSASIAIMAKICADLSNLSWGELAKGGSGLLGITAILVTASKLMSKSSSGALKGASQMILMATSIAIIGRTLSKLSGMSWGDIAKGLVAIGGATAILAIGLKAMSGTLAGSAALLVAASALLVFTPVLTTLGSMSLASIGKSILVLAGAFVVLGVAGAVLATLTPAILALSTAIALMGVGFALAGVGITSLATGLTSLAAAGAVSATTIASVCAAIITGVVELIPTIAVKVAEGIVMICETMVGSADRLITAGMNLIVSLLDALVNYAPTIIDYICQFVIKIFEGLTQRVAEMVDAGVKFIVELFAAIIDSLKNIEPEMAEKAIAGIAVVTGIIIGLNLIGQLIGGAMSAVLKLAVLIVEIGAIFAAFGALSRIPGLTDLVEDGGQILAKVGYAIGEFIGSIIGGLGAGLTSGLPAIGQNLADFATNVQPFINGVSAVDQRVLDGAKALAGAILVITASDFISGILSFLAGGSSLVEFTKQLIPFGEGMIAFSNTISGLDTDLVTKAAIAGTAIAELAKSLPKTGGVFSWFGGDEDMTEFSDQLEGLGKGLSKFSEVIIGIDTAKVSESISVLQQSLSIFKNYASTFGQGMNSLGASGLEGFCNVFANSGNAIKQSVSVLIANFNTAVSSQQKNMSKPFTTVIANIVTAMRNMRSQFSEAGQYLGEGLVIGMNAKKTAVYNAGYKLGQEAVRGEKDGQKSKSPSKLTVQAGIWLGEGLIIGMKTISHSVYKTGQELGETSTTAMSSTISKIAEIFGSDLDSQPTIRPVVDLSEVRAGADSITGMFSKAVEFGPVANAGIINTAMNRQIQNSGDSEIVSAIRDLRKDVGNLENRSYTIGGITYSAGDEVSNAIETLVRAVRVEGRV